MGTNEDNIPYPNEPDTEALEGALLREEKSRIEVSEETPEIQELRRALDILDKADKAYKIYPSNSVILKDFIDRAYNKLKEFLDAHGSIQLSILPTELRYEREKVFEAEIRETSLPFKLYEGGLRLLGFFPGLERSELISFLDVMKAIREVDEDEDNVVTLLWEKDVAHITYLVMDREMDTGTGEVDKIPDPDIDRSEFVKRIKLRDVSQRVDESEIDEKLLPQTDVESTGATIYGLSDEDKEEIAQRLAFEENYVPLYDFVTLLFSIFRTERDWDTFYELSKILEKILIVLATRGDYEVCSSVLSEMESFIDTEENLSNDHRQVFWDVLSQVGSVKRLEEAAIYLAGADSENANHVFDFFRQLGPSALPNLCNVITEQHEERFMELITQLGKENPAVVGPCLRNSNPLVVRTMLRILDQGGASEALADIAELLDHEDPAIRLEAIETLAGTGLPKAGNMLIPLLNDPDAQARKAALRHMVRLSGDRAFDAILPKIDTKDFILKSFYEKRDLMLNACKADGARGVPLLQRILQRSSFFQREKNNETRQCAAMALGELGSVHALGVLRELQNSRNKTVRDACVLALKRAEGKEVTRKVT
ncbi:MAG: HEAT repeat domain-containing protein [Planctomycetota bacterium]|nr:HEAT repeat domain-containing protein [Planctomycetota bacterium]